MAKNQKEATFVAIMAVISAHGITVQPGTSVSTVMSKELRSEVRDILCEGFKAGEIELDRDYDTDEALKNYVSGLVSNWIRKDVRLNGGTKYQPKNPGTRAGNGDTQLKALRGVLTMAKTDEEKQEIQGYIDARIAELNKAKAPTVDVSALPEALRLKYS
jgi:hypothetical protein